MRDNKYDSLYKNIHHLMGQGIGAGRGAWGSGGGRGLGI